MKKILAAAILCFAFSSQTVTAQYQPPREYQRDQTQTPESTETGDVTTSGENHEDSYSPNNSSYNTEEKAPFKKQAYTKVSMGVNAGFALIEDESGLAIGLFAELDAGSFAFVPQANYWKVKDNNNFELAGLVRMSLSNVGLMPYVDGGLGVNFYNSDADDFTKLGIAVGGGFELSNLGQNYNLLVDAKYKVIINDPGNIDGWVVTAGIKFPLQ